MNELKSSFGNSATPWNHRILAALATDKPQWTDVRSGFAALSELLTDTGEPRGAAAFLRLGQLAELAEHESIHPGSRDGVESILDFCRQQMVAFDEGRSIEAWGTQVLSEVNERWNDILGPDNSELDITNPVGIWKFSEEGLNASAEPFDGHPRTVDSISKLEIRALLSALESPARESARTEQSPPKTTRQATTPGAAGTSRPAPDESPIDPELLSAFLDDAVTCLRTMEASLDEVREQSSPEEPLRQFCRQLHTLKGASGSVGLRRLSTFLHHLEDQIEEMEVGARPLQEKLLATGVDAVRSMLGELGASEFDLGDSAVAVAEKPGTSPAFRKSTSGSGSRSASQLADTDTSVRIETTRVDHLLDLLSELVMLRGRRETNLHQFRRLKEELDRCIERTRNLGAGPGGSRAGGPSVIFPPVQASKDMDIQLRAVMELANDLAELGQSLRAILEPMENDNSAVSLLIEGFRRELMDLRRLPMTGLFRRIEKAAFDAARSENKQIEVEFRGHGTRAERSLQERLFEPLMHLVRNAVGHGIESSEDRRSQGKPELGRIILEATSTPTTLVIEIRDDGRGLDDRALERKGKELGLIPPGHKPPSRELWNLIFHPGFSTRDTVTEVAGRGVGMDVVATRIRQLRGRLTVDSTPRRGTVFRVLIPLRSPIEHAMIVRAGGQCFALPMPSVFGLGDGGDRQAEQTVVCLCELLGLPDSGRQDKKILTLGQISAQGTEPSSDSRGGTSLRDRRVSIAVDAVLGVAEVVVRSLPRMLAGHDLFSGVTLGADAEIVLMFDVPQLIDRGLQAPPTTRTSSGRSPSTAASLPGNQFPLAPVNVTAEPPHPVKTSPPAPPEASTSEQVSTPPPVTSETPETDEVPSGESTIPGPPPGNWHALPILVVDDSLSVRLHIVRKLEALGFSTAEAGDGQDALEMLRTRSFAAMITDIDMPRINGTALLAEIRQRSAWRGMPIYVVSSRTERLLQEQLQKLGARQVFTKPITDSNVGEIATQVIALGGASRYVQVKERT